MKVLWLFLVALVIFVSIVQGCGAPTPTEPPYSGTNEMKPKQEMVFEEELIFEVVNLSHEVPPIENHELYTGWVGQVEKKSAQEVFQYLRENPAATKDRRTPEDSLCCAGRLKGSIYSLDEFSVLGKEQSGDRLEYSVRFVRPQKYDSLPTPAQAYFRLLLGKIPLEVKTVVIRFEYLRYLGKDMPEPPPALSDVTIQLHNK